MVEWKGDIKAPSEQFEMRQPEHIPLAATLGLGIFDPKRIDHRRIEIGGDGHPAV